MTQSHRQLKRKKLMINMLKQLKVNESNNNCIFIHLGRYINNKTSVTDIN